MTNYTLTDGNGITRDDGASIPADPENRDYAAYLQWVEDGNTAAPSPKVLSVNYEDVRELRRQAFVVEADPLFFKWKAGEEGYTEETWQTARENVRVRYLKTETDDES